MLPKGSYAIFGRCTCPTCRKFTFFGLRLSISEPRHAVYFGSCSNPGCVRPKDTRRFTVFQGDLCEQCWQTTARKFFLEGQLIAVDCERCTAISVPGLPEDQDEPVTDRGPGSST